MKGGGAVHNINLQIPVGGNIKSNKTQASAGDKILLTATPDVGSAFMNFELTNLTTLEKEIKIENPLTYIMPDSDISVGAVFGETEIPTGYLGTQDKSVARTTFTVPAGIKVLQVVDSPGVYVAVTPNKAYTVEKVLYPQGTIRCSIMNSNNKIEWMSLRCPTVEVAQQRIAAMQLYFAYSPNINTVPPTVLDEGTHSGGAV